LIRKTFPEDPHVAVAVAECESGLKPTAYNPINKNGSTDGGLWQINTVHDKKLKELGLNKYNPEDATKFARMLYEKNGWQDWVCYTHRKVAIR
jgi:Lysozyme like domain